MATAMELALGSPAFIAAAACAALMGFAIQRGGTCTVAAVDELVTQRKAWRLAALVEASLWVAGCLLVAEALRMLPAMPHGFAVSAATLFGAAMLGYGAFINRACVFGTVARIGSGEWVYLLTPLGFLAGCLGVGRLPGTPEPATLGGGSPVLMAAFGGALVLAAAACWRLVRPLRSLRRDWRGLATRVWSPHAATTVIGITFALLFMLVGAWAYTDVLAEAARGMTDSFVGRAVLMLALLAGAVAGGWTAGGVRATRASLPQALRCFGGGALMGAGSLVLPGGNDSLILIGMPLLWPYAWVAFATMCVTIGLAIALHTAFGRVRAAHHPW